jgi:bile acid:Na+ symporter, BASS family
VAASMIHNLAGYLLGYYGAWLAKLDESSCRTVAIEVGLQNGGMATALAINTLKDPLAALAPAIFGPWMNISGSVLASWWGAHEPKVEASPLPKTQTDDRARALDGES